MVDGSAAGARDILLMGIPRSGTTLACKLLCGLPNVVTLVEPMQMSSLQGCGREAAVDRIAAFLRSTRERLVTAGVAVSGQQNGAIPDNMFEPVHATSLRRKVTQSADCPFPGLTADFTLLVKHPAGFTALLDLLNQRYACFALIRNPLAVLASWNTVSAPFEDGHSPAAERFDERLRAGLANIPGKLDRQLHLMSWYFEQYRRWLPTTGILRYENLVASRGHSLAAIVPSAGLLNVDIHSRNANPLYGSLPLRTLAQALLRSRGGYWDFYARQSVVDLADRLQLLTNSGRTTTLLSVDGDCG